MRRPRSRFSANAGNAAAGGGRAWAPTPRLLYGKPLPRSADPAHRRTVETVAGHPGLAGLELDVVVLQPDGVDAAPKLLWARSCLARGKAEVFAVGFESP